MKMHMVDRLRRTPPIILQHIETIRPQPLHRDGLGGGVTTFLVSQRIACIRQADQILVLDNGSLAGVGTHEELLERCGLYQEIFDSQFPGEREKKEGNV